jgi:hypothetical protein
VLKHRAVAALGQTSSSSISARLSEEHDGFYDIRDTLVDIFHEIREISAEVQISDERKNLIRAREYYGDVPIWFRRPSILDRERHLHGSSRRKVTDAFPNSPRPRKPPAG